MCVREVGSYGWHSNSRHDDDGNHATCIMLAAIACTTCHACRVRTAGQNITSPNLPAHLLVALHKLLHCVAVRTCAALVKVCQEGLERLRAAFGGRSCTGEVPAGMGGWEAAKLCK